MTNNNYISIKVCGNPQGVGGIQTIANFNETERINIPDDPQINAGFCPGNEFSYWFKIKTEAQRTIYSLGTHKVLSGDGSDRGGRLVIAISIPKGNKLGDNKSPYDVLVELKDYFLSKYMTSASNIRGTYFRYSSEPIPTNAFDEIAKSYTLIPHKGPHRPMIGTSIGYVIANNQMIKELMSDAQYPEFTRFSEIIIANTGSRIGCTPINGLTIPRRAVYRIMENGTEISRTSDVNARVTITGVQNPEYYKNIEEDFTITELRNGATPTGVLGLDEENEVVNVDRALLSKPIEKEILLNVSGGNLGVVTGKDFDVKYGNIPLPVSQNCTIKLIGQQLNFLKDPSRFSIYCCKKRVGSISVEGDSLRGVIVTVAPPMGGSGSSKSSGSSVSTLGIKFFNISLQQNLKPITLDKKSVDFSYDIVDGDNKTILQRTKGVQLIQNVSSGRHECLIAVPQRFVGRKIRLCIYDCLFSGTLRSDANSDVSELKNFTPEGAAPLGKGNLLNLLGIALIALLLGVGGGGYAAYSYANKKAEKKVQEAQTEAEMKVKEAEDKVPRYKCKDCGALFMDNEALGEHTDTAHKRSTGSKGGGGSSKTGDSTGSGGSSKTGDSTGGGGSRKTGRSVNIVQSRGSSTTPPTTETLPIAAARSER